MQTSGVVDANGIGEFSYQWYVNINNSVTVLAGETGATYTMELSDFCNWRCGESIVGFECGRYYTRIAAGYTQDYEAVLSHADNVLSGNVELSLLGGIVAENATVYHINGRSFQMRMAAALYHMNGFAEMQQ